MAAFVHVAVDPAAALSTDFLGFLSAHEGFIKCPPWLFCLAWTFGSNTLIAAVVWLLYALNFLLFEYSPLGSHRDGPFLASTDHL